MFVEIVHVEFMRPGKLCNYDQLLCMLTTMVSGNYSNFWEMMVEIVWTAFTSTDLLKKMIRGDVSMIFIGYDEANNKLIVHTSCT